MSEVDGPAICPECGKLTVREDGDTYCTACGWEGEEVFVVLEDEEK